MAIKVVNSNTQMGASGANHASGAVPDPGASAGSSKFLREDAVFALPGGVASLNGETGAITLESTGGTIDITEPTGTTINFEVDAGHVVTSLNGSTGAVTYPLRATGTITVTTGVFSSATITVTGATTAMTAIPSLAPGVYTSGTIFVFTMTAAVTSANTVTVRAEGLGDGTSPITASIVVLVF